GMADPHSARFPFAQFEAMHYARFAILDDPTLVDLEAYGLPTPRLPLYLSFMVDCDGPGGEMLVQIAQRAGTGLRRIFSHCEGYDESADLLAWLRARDIPIAAPYINWVGRTVRQVKEESSLQRALAARVPRTPVASGAQAQRVRQELRAFVDAEVSATRLTLTPMAPTPPAWQIAKIAHLIVAPLIWLP